MADRKSEPVLPIPADLYQRLHGVGDRLDDLRRELLEIRREYAELRRQPDVLAVDNLGEPIEPLAAANATLHELARSDADLNSANNWLAHARSQYASRLRLTDHACEQREQQLTQRRPPIERTR